MDIPNRRPCTRGFAERDLHARSHLRGHHSLVAPEESKRDLQIEGPFCFCQEERTGSKCPYSKASRRSFRHSVTIRLAPKPRAVDSNRRQFSTLMSSKINRAATGFAPQRLIQTTTSLHAARRMIPGRLVLSGCVRYRCNVFSMACKRS